MVGNVDDLFHHVTPEIVSLAKTNTPTPNKYQVTLMDIIYCLEGHVDRGFETERHHYQPHRRALLAQGHILPEIVVIVACFRGSILEPPLDISCWFGLSTGRNPPPLHTRHCLRAHAKDDQHSQGRPITH